MERLQVLVCKSLMAATWPSRQSSDSSAQINTCDRSDLTAKTSFLITVSRLRSIEASSDLAGRLLTRAATTERRGEILSPSEPMDEAGDRYLEAGLCLKVELAPAPHREQPRQSGSGEPSDSVARNCLIEPEEVFFVGRVLPVLLPTIPSISMPL